MQIHVNAKNIKSHSNSVLEIGVSVRVCIKPDEEP